MLIVKQLSFNLPSAAYLSYDHRLLLWITYSLPPTPSFWEPGTMSTPLISDGPRTTFLQARWGEDWRISLKQIGAHFVIFSYIFDTTPVDDFFKKKPSYFFYRITVLELPQFLRPKAILKWSQLWKNSKSEDFSRVGAVGWLYSSTGKTVLYNEQAILERIRARDM